jgi:hypothetical protein
MTKKNDLLVHGLIIAGYLVLTLIFTYPLIVRFTTHTLGDGCL